MFWDASQNNWCLSQTYPKRRCSTILPDLECLRWAWCSGHAGVAIMVIRGGSLWGTCLLPPLSTLLGVTGATVQFVQRSWAGNRQDGSLGWAVLWGSGWGDRWWYVWEVGGEGYSWIGGTQRPVWPQHCCLCWWVPGWWCISKYCTALHCGTPDQTQSFQQFWLACCPLLVFVTLIVRFVQLDKSKIENVKPFECWLVHAKFGPRFRANSCCQQFFCHKTFYKKYTWVGFQLCCTDYVPICVLDQPLTIDIINYCSNCLLITSLLQTYVLCIYDASKTSVVNFKHLALVWLLTCTNMLCVAWAVGLARTYIAQVRCFSCLSRSAIMSEKSLQWFFRL